MVKKKVNRCSWAGNDPLMIEYHDKIWGVPEHDDTKLFEFLILEGAQAGLSWSTILKRREAYREAYLNFDAHKLSKFKDKEIQKLLENSAIIRNKLKIKSAITNAQIFVEIQKEYGSFDKYIWQFVDGKPIKNKFNTLSDIPASIELSKQMSKAMKKRGFSFVGPTICYAFMQAVGMVNDHLTDCFRYDEISN
jgi:DNA-3-methyladenine glycosylase I